MFLDTIVLPKNHTLYWFTDPHCLATGFSEPSFREAIYYIKSDPSAVVFFGGDYSSYFDKLDKRRHRQEERGVMLAEPYKYFANEIIKGGILNKVYGVFNGNHDDDHDDIPMTLEFICRTLKKKYYGYLAKVNILDKYGNKMYKALMTHGRGRLTSDAYDPTQARHNPLLRVKRRISKLAGDVDIMMVAHFHLLDYLEPIQTIYLVDDGKELKAKYTHSQMSSSSEYIHPDLRWYLYGGSFQRAQIAQSAQEIYEKYILTNDIGFREETGFAERFMLSPRELGMVSIKCVNGNLTKAQKIII